MQIPALRERAAEEILDQGAAAARRRTHGASLVPSDTYVSGVLADLAMLSGLPTDVRELVERAFTGGALRLR